MKKLLVTGASGFLGSNLVRELYRQGYEVRILVRHTANLSHLDTPCEVFFGDISDPFDTAAAVAGCNIIVHAASITDQWGVSFDTYEQVNYVATKHIVTAALEAKIEKLIYVSTANTLGPGSIENPGNELNGFALFHANSGYINSKYLAQQYVLEQVERSGLPAVVVNPTFMIGANDVKPSSGKLVLHSIASNVTFHPPGGKNFVHITDVCMGIINAIQHGKVGDCYLLAGSNLSYRQFFRLRNRLTRQRSLLIQLPAFVLKLAGLIGSLTERITGKCSKLNYTGATLLCLNNYYTGKKSERELGLKYTPIEIALKNALNWFKEHNYY